jgi:Ca2+-binding EF-hand superfamily protein
MAGNRSVKTENHEFYKYIFSVLNNDDDDAAEILADEVGTFLRLAGRAPSTLEVKRVVSELDPRKTGWVSFDGLCDYLDKSRTTHALKDESEELRRAFQMFDRLSIGFVTAVDLRFALQSMGDKMSESEFLEMVKGGGFLRDGKFFYEGNS